MMKRLIRRLTFFVVLFVFVSEVSAQEQDYVPTPCQSIRNTFSSIKEHKSIVRSNNDYRVVHIQYNEPLSGLLHTFVIKRFSPEYEIALSANFNIGAPFCITDMRIYNGEFYYCGTVVSDVLDMEGNPITYGVVGHFSPQAFFSGSGHMYVTEVKEVSTLTRLEINTSSSQLELISAIGTKDNNTNACIVELRHVALTGGTMWTKNLDYLNPTFDIYFSDIMYTGDSLTLLSQFKCSNNYLPGHASYDTRHQMFLLDRSGIDGFSTLLAPIWTHNMAQYNIDNDSYCKFHSNRCPMRLCHIDVADNGFGVAFGVRETELYKGGIRLFPFGNTWYYDSCIYYRTGVHAEIRDIGNLHGTSQLFVVSEDATYSNGLVTLPTLGSAAHDVYWLVDTGYTYNSISQSHGTVLVDVDITGHKGPSDYTLFQQSINSLILPSCFTKVEHHYDVFAGKHSSSLLVNWCTEKKEEPIWKEVELTEIELKVDDECKKCGYMD